jgi:uncharacterized DUF497 family protein
MRVAVGVRVGPKKAEQNLRKHGVEFIDAVIVFDDDLAITLIDEHPTEERYLTLAWTLRDGYWRFHTR